MSKWGKTPVQPKGPDPGANQGRRFHEACEAMKRNAAKFADCELSSDSSEEEIDEAEVMRKTLSNYADDGTQNLRKIREFLQDILTSGAVVCLICIESVKRSDEVWSCRDCYCMLHLHCIQKWAKDSVFHLSSANQEQGKEGDIKWCCPKCRSEYGPSERPSTYRCFCGKVERPRPSVWGVPHACEGTCEKPLKPDCGHMCCLMCHPGPCPPCPQTVLVSCCCSKSAKVARRCSHKDWFCGKPCGRALPCGTHNCEESCHSGPCPPCERQSPRRCECGAESAPRPCHDANWRCGRACGKPLPCGNHRCDMTCHSGACEGCPGSGPRPCPCGKLRSVLPCTEGVRPCGDTCGRLLECGLHRCGQRCHPGPCEECLQMRTVRCRCGQREKSVPCRRADLLCDAKCRKRRDCGRHNCSRKCCAGHCPPCELPCGRTLNCGKHKCASLCHPGPCYPCHVMADVSCSCGSTRISVPCGRKRSAVPPRCSSDCRLPPDCHHPERHRHKCHSGPCPGCRLACGKALRCGHACPARCHTAVLTRVDVKQKKEGPWDLRNSARMELVCRPCPPCALPVDVACWGGHETRPFPCSGAVSSSCGLQCGRPLPCGNHVCSLQCHLVEDKENTAEASPTCEPCQEPCLQPRKCAHECPLPCHPGQCRPCKQHLKLKCHCGINAVYVACCDWTDADEEGRSRLLACSNRCPKEISCGHRCIRSCHPGPCSTRADCRKKVTLRCPCRRRKKEVPCNALPAEHPIAGEEEGEDSRPRPLPCDADCSAHREAELASESEKLLLQKEAELKAQERELQEFVRKTEGKKKRRKKHIESPVEDKRRAEMLFVGALVVCVVGCAVYLLSQYL